MIPLFLLSALLCTSTLLVAQTQSQAGSASATGTDSYAGTLLDANCQQLSQDKGRTSSTGSTATTQDSSSQSEAQTAGDSKYAACRVTQSTTSFAVFSNGKVIPLDSASNAKVKDQITSSTWFKDNAAGNRDMNVRINGSMSGENLQVNSLTIR